MTHNYTFIYSQFTPRSWHFNQFHSAFFCFFFSIFHHTNILIRYGWLNIIFIKIAWKYGWNMHINILILTCKRACVSVCVCEKNISVRAGQVQDQRLVFSFWLPIYALHSALLFLFIYCAYSTFVCCVCVLCVLCAYTFHANQPTRHTRMCTNCIFGFFSHCLSGSRWDYFLLFPDIILSYLFYWWWRDGWWWWWRL